MRDATFPRGIEVAVAALIRNKEGKLLFASSPKWNGKWVLPGGHIDPGESMIEAAKREALEETGLSLIYKAVIHSGELISPPQFHRTLHMIFFTLLFEAGDEEPVLDGIELTEYGWFTLEEASKLDLAPPNDIILNKYNSYLKQTSTD